MVYSVAHGASGAWSRRCVVGHGVASSVERKNREGVNQAGLGWADRLGWPAEVAGP
jgi:hypothetical protein